MVTTRIVTFHIRTRGRSRVGQNIFVPSIISRTSFVLDRSPLFSIRSRKPRERGKELWGQLMKLISTGKEVKKDARAAILDP